MRIQDDGDQIIFRNPRYFSQLDDESFIFFDYPSLYKYNVKGKLQFKIPEMGEGPAECISPNYYYFDGEIIYVTSCIPPKIMKYDIHGKFIKEQKVPKSTFVYLGYIENRIIGIRDEIHYSEFIHKQGFFETPYTLYEISPDFRKKRKILDIPVEHYIKERHWWRRTGFAFVPYKHYLFSLHTAEYQIDKINLRSGRIENSFKRPYNRIKSKKHGSSPDIYNPTPKNLQPPAFDYEWDSNWVQVVNNTLWVFTSTKKDNMTLIDVFDMEGHYIDNFYLRFPENNEDHRLSHSLITNEGICYFLDENKETGLLSIGKYKIKDG
ncbi:MAG: 6-bladed beta-propeller [Candidatus Aminicenantes bacterium]|nr:6-bladed beta-propeller [Candidatus Aminicenantes bacterium]